VKLLIFQSGLSIGVLEHPSKDWNLFAHLGSRCEFLWHRTVST